MAGALRFLTFGFHLLLGLFLLAVGLIGWWTGDRIRFEWIPEVAPLDMASTLLALGFVALASMLLAAFRWKPLRIPFFAWNLLAAAAIVRALGAPSFRFDGTENFLCCSIVLVAALLGVSGSWDHFRGSSPSPRLKTASGSGEGDQTPVKAAGQDD